MGERFQGPGGQSYVVESVRQWRLFHPVGTAVIHLVVDEVIATSDPTIAALRKREEELWRSSQQSQDRTHPGDRRVRDIHIIQEGTGIQVSPAFLIHFTQSLRSNALEWRKYYKYFYIQGYMHPGGSKSTGNTKFNQLVSERFFAVEALMRRYGLRNIVHLENDIMVYDNFLPMIHAAMRCGYQMTTTVIHVKGVIPSVLYVRSAESIGRFTSYLTEFLRCGSDFGKAIQHGYANDMTYLKNFYHLYGSRALGIFPTWRHERGELCINTVLDTWASAAQNASLLTDDASAASSAQATLLEVYSLVVERIAWQLSVILRRGQFVPTNNEPSLPSSIVRLPTSKGGSIMDGASFGQWYSAVAVADPSYVFHSATVDRAKERGTRVVPPQHIRNSMQKRFLDATPPQVMTWERYHGHLEIMVPAWGDYRLATLHIHQKNLGLFSSLHPRLQPTQTFPNHNAQSVTQQQP